MGMMMTLTTLYARAAGRLLLAVSLAVLTVMFAVNALTMAHAEASDPIVETMSGKVRGSMRDEVAVFKGIPYGEKPAGVSRFMPPRPPQPWSGVRDASQYGLLCPQADLSSRLGSPALAAIFGVDAGDPEPEKGENCLVLNVWTPEVDVQGDRPVLVWIHGGAFAGGASNYKDDSGTDGYYLAKRHNVVVVSMNHRLASLGYMDLSDIGGSQFASSGTVGMQDLVLSLRWVRDNIARFGGDPRQVMIFGESGGGAKVSTLLAMPSAKGLFKTAIIASGPGLTMVGPEEATANTMKLLSELQVQTVEELQELSWEKLVEAQGKVGTHGFVPVVDGAVLPQHPFNPVAAPTAAGIPLIIGATKDEATTFLVADPNFGEFTEEEVRERLAGMLRMFDPQTKNSERLYTAYREKYKSSTPTQLLVKIASDQIMMLSLQLADRKAAGGDAPVFVYKFAYETDVMGGILGSPHAIDIPFNFDATHTMAITGTKLDKEQVARQLVTGWVAFAKSGNPNNAMIPEWPAHKPGSNQAMWIDTEWQVGPAVPEDIFEAWRAFYAQVPAGNKTEP